jgi:hypothetical protein
MLGAPKKKRPMMGRLSGTGALRQRHWAGVAGISQSFRPR